MLHRTYLEGRIDNRTVGCAEALVEQHRAVGERQRVDRKCARVASQPPSADLRCRT